MDKKSTKNLIRRFGKTDYRLADVPNKISNIRMLIANGESLCPCCCHGNKRDLWRHNRKNWKRYRKTQYRIKND